MERTFTLTVDCEYCGGTGKREVQKELVHLALNSDKNEALCAPSTEGAYTLNRKEVTCPSCKSWMF